MSSTDFCVGSTQLIDEDVSGCVDKVEYWNHRLGDCLIIGCLRNLVSNAVYDGFVWLISLSVLYWNIITFHAWLM